MRAALLLVDFQEAFLSEPDLRPSRGELVARTTALLEGFRAAGRPVIHEHRAIGGEQHGRQIDDAHHIEAGNRGAQAHHGRNPESRPEEVLVVADQVSRGDKKQYTDRYEQAEAEERARKDEQRKKKKR